MFNDNTEERRAAVQQTPPDKTPELWLLRILFRKWRRKLYNEDITKNFANAIKKGCKDEVKTIFKSYKFKINPSYQDSDGNTLLHLLINLPYGGDNYVRMASDIKVPNYIKNNEGKLPCEVSNSCYVNIVGGKDKEDFLQRRKEERNKLVTDMSEYYRENWSGGIFPGKRVVDDLKLYFECEEGRCEVPDSWAELDALDFRNLSLHQRLAIANHLSSARAQDAETMSPDKTSNCYVTAAFTMVVTEHQLDYEIVPYKLKAITIAINVPDHMVYTSGEKYAHAEEVLFAYLNNAEVLKDLISQVKIKGSIASNHKCYGVVFDMHITNSMCGCCEQLLYNLLSDRSPGSLMLKLESAIKDSELILPAERTHIDLLTPTTSRIFFTPRVSCNKSFSYEAASDEAGYKYLTFNDFDNNISDNERNIANHRNAVIFHTQFKDKKRKYSFSTKDRGDYVNCYVPNQTAFVMKLSDIVANSGWPYEQRKCWAQPVLFSKIDKGLSSKSGLFITKNSSKRFDEAGKECIGGFLAKEQDESAVRLKYYRSFGQRKNCLI